MRSRFILIPFLGKDTDTRMPRKERRKYRSDYDALIDYLDQMGADVVKSFSIKDVPRFLRKNQDHPLYNKAAFRLSKVMSVKGLGIIKTPQEKINGR